MWERHWNLLSERKAMWSCKVSCVALFVTWDVIIGISGGTSMAFCMRWVFSMYLVLLLRFHQKVVDISRNCDNFICSFMIQSWFKD